ncbi:MAG: 3-deoxy-manno-octulosonate cytidylyltransferase [Pseudomonadota bacterium]
MSDVHIVIPARMASSRLPGKPLLDIAGKPMIQHVWLQARAADVGDVTIATDSAEIADTAKRFGADCVLTRADHQSGTDRIAEVADKKSWARANIINVQGDEPFIPPEAIRQVAALLVDNPEADLATLCALIEDDAERENPNCVKVVTDSDGFALYFSRAAIPFARNEGHTGARRHIGIYGYRLAALQKMVAASPCELELAESLEQLRALWLGMRIVVADAVSTPMAGIDTAEDLAQARALMSAAS